ncbi:putative nuclear migration protein [Aspergillus candidus]|uniref:Pleckstrin homology domain-containing protein n=1 Tax=Aspergillus candidus TaxID=41067 RepID=A0A2I2FP61_ASPCN|nr:hypothetical protein BDW47DRAFT_121528 [Aspergillus candidus]PLB42414.1 hypothetical protein BDW47DRAFT_121528 [Aspergillus candidus]
MATDAVPQSPPTRAIPTPSTTPPTDHPAQTRRGSSAGYSSSNFSLRTENASPDRPSDYEDIMDEDTISPLDPRRFTPTLHASLVSEILALRRDVEGKTKAIDVLERSLDDSRIENDDLSDRLAKSTRETRSLKHQLNLLEGGSSSALTELAKERDTALDNIGDVRKKLDQAQKKARGRDEELERSLKLWDRERESWETDRRALERKVHVVEGRLKVVLNEVAAAQAAGSFRSTAATNADEAASAKEEALGKDSDSASILSSSQGPRRTSVTSVSSNEDDYRDFHNVRYSVASLANIPSGKSDGMNLADELAFDEEDEFDLADDDMAPDSPEALPEERPASVHSQISQTMGMGAKARRILGLSLESGVDGQGIKVDGVSELDTSVKVSTKAVYQDTGIQYSPPPSPMSPEFEYPLSQNDRDVSGQTKDSGTSTDSADMVSTSCQTVGDIPTPPRTPKLDELLPQPSAPKRAITVSTAVQTEQELAAEPEKPSPALQGAGSDSLQIPMIAIHPPHSEPPSPRGSVVLPPQTKSVSCQANFGPMVSYQTVGMQTEPIRIDQRPVKLPASLLPSAIPDFPPSKNDRDPPIQPYRAPPPRTRPPSDVQPPPLPPKAPSRSKPPGRVQAYPGNNDNGPLSEESKTGMRRPLRSSSLFAGFEESSDEGSPESTRDIFTDDAFLNRPTATYKLRRGKLVSTEERSTLDDPVLPEVVEDEHLLDPDSQLFHASGSSVRDVDGTSRQRTGTVASGGRQQDIRRAAMISNGASAHQKIRARSPSEPTFDSASASGASNIPPPFPVPIRLSSRKFPAEGSDGRQSPTPSNPRNFSDRGRAPAARRPILRRVRSAAAMSQTDHTERPSSRSSPAMSVSSQAPESPRYPPLPYDDVTAHQGKYGGRRRSVRRAAPHTLAHEREDSAATSVQPTSVVDAIAQTMVGEWMFKYVRRRRSFGVVGESKDSWEGRNADEVSASITNSGVRHKRWVWLAPYERAVMWSSKQPTSGPALLGKTGRKLIIQSVLDVKDDNPLPKGTNAQNQFNRSILILTPQRALKFTAMSIERHYVWLTALSFLSHSTMGVQDLASLPPAPQEEFSSPVPAPALRRNPIRDSIKIAKGRPRPGPKPKLSFNQPEPVPELPLELETADSIDGAADPPTVPRFSNHARKRSNPTTRMPVLRNFSSQATMPSIASTRGSSEAHTPSQGPGVNSGRSSLSHRTSEASTGTGNFFDAVGTVRMEAFIDQTESNRNRVPGRRKRKTSSPWSAGSPAHLDLDIPAPIPALTTEDDDLFRGF